MGAFCKKYLQKKSFILNIPEKYRNYVIIIVLLYRKYTLTMLCRLFRVKQCLKINLPAFSS